MSKTVLIDLDNVLADFDGGISKLWGMTPEELTLKRTRGEWTLIHALGVTLNEFWDKVNSVGEAFWTSLEPTPWAKELLDTVDRMTEGNWYVVTTPSSSNRGAHSLSGKMKWLIDFSVFFRGKERVVMVKDKWLMAVEATDVHFNMFKPRILIDDRGDTISKFNAKGGIGILFPHIGNEFHYTGHDPLPQVLTALKQMIGD